MKKMFVEVYQENTLKNTWTNQQDITMQLLSYFFKEKKSKKYNNFSIKIYDKEEDSMIVIKTWFYNYENKKEITTLKFYNIPIKMGWLDTYTINKLIDDEIKEVIK